ncbi:RNA polymerase sigma factor [Niabella ginsengisoli]|uniref:Sigma-70 family RNA polymerase sigma factor n=1 Tax=Niabella ginsengisoli TaxID=522298 RepID=A0ABS9SHN0_9BACT|nr:sigma-70 family RNA polymerase sigma factor [Niabella ginsengisoli]MCH5597866.1 sigma-70 family RNA polymerase sigma factor [Niabella ginsengisoli]
MITITSYYNKYRIKLLAIAYHFGYTTDEAEDIVQQFFLDFMQKELPKDIHNPEAFIVIAFKRKLIDHFRANKNRKYTDNFDDIHVPSTQEILESLETDEELIEKLAEAYKKLPARCRRVIYMKYYCGYSTQEIVKQTGLTEQNVYNNLSKGITNLRKSLEYKVEMIRFGSLLSFIF